MKPDQEIDAAVFLGLQAWRMKNPNAADSLLPRIDSQDLESILPWISTTPIGLQPNLRRMLTWVSKAEVEILRSNESARGEAVIGWTKQARERNFTEFPRKKIEEHIDEAESPAERLAAGGGARARRVHENTVKRGDEKVQMATEDIGQGLERFVHETPEEASFVWVSGLSPNDDNDFLVKTVEGCLEDLAIHHLVGAPTAAISDPRNWHQIDPNNERQLLSLPLSEAIQFKGVDCEGRNRPLYSISMSRANRKIVSPKGKVTELGKSLICAQPGSCVAENLGNRVLGLFRPLAVQARTAHEDADETPDGVCAR